MANPRRTSYSTTTGGHHHHPELPISDPTATGTPFSTQSQTQTQKLLTSIKNFLKKPHAFPLLLSVLLFLTWVSLRIQYQQQKQNPNSSSSTSYNLKSGLTRVHDDVKDDNANLIKFSSSSKTIMKDKRGWLLDPVEIALHAGISGGAMTCESVHLGEIRPGGLRGNHRHHFCNETFVIWGAKTIFRLENSAADKGYGQVTIGPDEVIVAASPRGTAHALINVDPELTTFFIGCQDSVINYTDSSTDFKVWKDL